MRKNIKTLGVLVLAGFSFFYTDKVVKIIRNNDPIMTSIKEKNNELMVTKLDRVIYNDEYLTGINGCIINEEESYDRMRVVGEYKEELLVMKEDDVKEEKDKYIIGGNSKNRNISIILYDNKITNEEKINYFLDGKYINENITKLKSLQNGYIYNYGRYNTYNKKYIIFDNSLINNNFKNKSNYCLVEEKNKEILNLCSSNNMKTIKVDTIKDNYLKYVKEYLTNGKIFSFSNIDNQTLSVIINYVKSKGYNIVSLDELLNESNGC